MQLVHNGLQVAQVVAYVPSVIRRELRRRVGHKCDLRRADVEHHREKLVGGVTFDIEFGFDERLELINVLLTDVSFVGSGVHRDAVGSEPLAVKRCLDNVRIIASAGITQGGYLIDIYT